MKLFYIESFVSIKYIQFSKKIPDVDQTYWESLESYLHLPKLNCLSFAMHFLSIRSLTNYASLLIFKIIDAIWLNFVSNGMKFLVMFLENMNFGMDCRAFIMCKESHVCHFSSTLAPFMLNRPKLRMNKSETALSSIFDSENFKVKFLFRIDCLCFF